jgi:glycosyltransferase involved in cell wall biosynthesis
MTIRDVAYVVNTFPKLSETFVANEIAALVRRGIRVRVLSLKAATERLQHPVVQTLPLAQMLFMREADFRQSLAAERPDVLHAHFATEPTRVARAIASDLGLPFSFTAHGYDVYRKPPVDLADRLRAAAAVVTVSSANADHLAAIAGADRERLHVVPCGVDVDHFCPAPSRVEPATIVCVARLRPVKNLGVLIDACHALAARGVQARAVIIGEGPSLPDLEAHRARVGLDDTQVTFLGAADQSAVRDWWQRATVGTLTSLSEGMPVSLMEAAACGVPVVAPAVGGIPELVADGVTGVVTPPNDAQAIADGLAGILTSPTRRAAMSAAARARATARFSLTQQVDALVDLWSHLPQAVPA